MQVNNFQICYKNCWSAKYDTYFQAETASYDLGTDFSLYQHESMHSYSLFAGDSSLCEFELLGTYSVTTKHFYFYKFGIIQY